MMTLLNSPRFFFVTMLGALAVIFTGNPHLYAQDGAAVRSIERDYQSAIRPLLRQYCYECHSDDVTEADIDLAVFRTIADVRKQTKTWLMIREMLDDGQMPPKDAKQPTDAERKRLQAWVRDVLSREAKALAGDPGPVVLRRLNNAEYTYSIRDLTGALSLDPTREFPVDGASGEGFTNAGSGQGMSPALIHKYLDAAKQVANHVVLLPDGIRFSRYTSRRDQTDELLARIQAFYRQFTEGGGGTAIDLHGIKFNTNQGGLLPLEEYLAATLAERDALASGEKTIDTVARQRSLNARYLTTLWKTLSHRSNDHPSFLIDRLRDKWKRAKASDAAALATEIALLQKALWKFNSIGHIGRENGPQSWLEAVSPITTRQELRFKLPDAPRGTEIVIYLAAGDLSDGNDHNFVVWQRPRIEFKAANSGSARPTILLRDVRSLVQRIKKTVASESALTKQYLATVAELCSSSRPIDEVAKTRGLNPRLLSKWDALAGVGQRPKREITDHFTKKPTRVGGYEATNGWGSPQTPSLLTNRSGQPISFSTLTVPARGVTVHPSPALESVVAWRSPIDARIRIEGHVADADNKSGNGVVWRLELLSDLAAAVLAQGVIDNGRNERFKLDKTLAVNKGDIVSFVVNARDNNHICDTTHIELKLTEAGGEKRVWNLASDIVDNVLNGNPLPDSFGNEEVWHFCVAGNKPPTKTPIAPGSALAHWQAAVIASSPADEVDTLARAVENVLTAEDVGQLNEPDKKLRQQLLDWKGPLDWVAASEAAQSDTRTGYGLDPKRFGRHPSGTLLGEADLCLQSPHVLHVRLPASLVAGAEFVTTGVLHEKSEKEGSVQLEIATGTPNPLAVPILVGTDSHARRRVEAAMKEFRELFPPALCYARLVPVDEVVTLTLFYREDDHLKRLMLDDQQVAKLDRLWDELYYVSREPLKLVVAFEQISEFATQDRPDLVKAFAPMRKPINARADLFRGRMLKTEPAHVDAVLEFAGRAWRRPLDDAEQRELRDLYGRLRDSEIPHEQAIRLMLARVLTSPAFLYKLEQPAPGKHAAPISDLELVTRLSYFLWSSTPDDELRTVAQAGKLASGKELITQTRRMLKHSRTRRLAIQFACQWLHLRDFDKNDDKNEKLYPEFAELRDDMYEETVRFFEDMFRNDGSILGLLDANHTFLNELLAKHYSIDGVKGNQWQRVDGVRAKGRGGILGMATFLASQSGASRTSPILRGNWVSETLLGERLPRPPAGVPQLPDAVPEGLTARQLIERHSSAPACAKCHARIDPYGFALEQYDAIGRIRPRAVNTKTKLIDGKELAGIEGLRHYLTKDRRDDVVRQFCRKLLGYSLGRQLQLSDEPLLDEVMNELAENDYRFSVAVEMIVTSRQFREIRGISISLD